MPSALNSCVCCEPDPKLFDAKYNRDMITKVVLALCGVALFVLPIVSVGQIKPAQQQEIDAHKRQASEYLRNNQLDLAASEFRAILALDPKNVDARGNLGVVLFFQGKYGDAIPHLREALTAQRTLWKIQALLGIAEKRTNNTAAAREDLEEAYPRVRDKKIRIETGLELIEIHSADGDLDKAAAIASDLRKMEPADEIVLYTAYRIYSDLANESLLSLSVVSPNSARLHQALAHELAKRGNTAEAVENYHAALKIDPNLPGLHFELAEMLHTLSTPEARQQAENEYKAALLVNPLDEQSECRLADIALEGGDLQEAKERYTRALQLQANDPEVSVGLAKVYMTMDQPKQAEALLLRAIKLDPTNATAHFRLATVYRLTGRPEEAKREFEVYQKYKEMKNKLRAIYQDFHAVREDEKETAGPRPQ
jgi:Tfp pilus assembly protein PilF